MTSSNFTQIAQNYCYPPDINIIEEPVNQCDFFPCYSFINDHPLLPRPDGWNKKFPGQVWLAANRCCSFWTGCWACPDPNSEWIDGPLGIIYSNVPIYNWNDSFAEDTISLVMREGDDTNCDDFLGAIKVNKYMTDTILFKLWMGGWIILENDTFPDDYQMQNIDHYWFHSWNGVYPDSNEVKSPIIYDQYLPLPNSTVDLMEERFVEPGQTIGILGRSFPDGIYDKPMIYTAPCEPALSGGSILTGVRLYNYPNFQGESRFFNTDIPDLDLGTINFADVSTSIRLYNLSGVKFYDFHDYGGCILPVNEDISDLTSLGWNDRIGSLKIASTPLNGVILYEHPNYEGDCRYLETNIPDLDLGTINFADVASSIKLVNVSGVKLYDFNNYGGCIFGCQ
ncbi:MAG: beta/gamma crystallin family protein [Bacteroidales bacterium]|nr:beta/gamma crystallin family protein [Bacteroidales bacterium]